VVFKTVLDAWNEAVGIDIARQARHSAETRPRH
jgi:hypothetical protein